MTDTRVHRFGPAHGGLSRGRRGGRPVAALAVAVLALGGLAGCGDDTGDGDSATDGSSSATSSPSASPSASSSESASGSASATPSDGATSEVPTVPAIDPLIADAVQGALKDRFPALIPTVLPQGWTVAGATYEKNSWSIALTDATGTSVLLTQRRGDLDDLVATVIGKGAQETGKVDLSAAGLGKWGVYEAGAAVGIGKDIADSARSSPPRTPTPPPSSARRC